MEEQPQRTPIQALLRTGTRRVNPDLPQTQIFTTLKPGNNSQARDLHTVKGVMFGVQQFKDAYGMDRVTINIGDQTGVMAVDLHQHRDSNVWETLTSISGGQIKIEMVGRVVALQGIAFPIFQVNRIASFTRPTVRELRTLARKMGIGSHTTLQKPHLVRAINDAQKELYCGTHFLSEQGDNHIRCAHA